MGEMITKPDANPVLLAALNFILWGGLGYFLMGQSKKAMIAWAVTAVLWMVLPTCTMGIAGMLTFPIGILWVLACSYDAYLLGQKLAAGESVGEVENGLDALNMIFK